MGRKSSLRGKALRFVSDLTTVVLNPISDKPSEPREIEMKKSGSEEIPDENDSMKTIDGPDTSSFTAFMFSLLSSSEAKAQCDEDKNRGEDDQTGPSTSNTNNEEDTRKRSLISKGKQSLSKAFQNRGEDDQTGPSTSNTNNEEDTRKRSLISKGKQSLSKAFLQVKRIGWYQNESHEDNVGHDLQIDENVGSKHGNSDLNSVQISKNDVRKLTLPEISEPSLLISEDMRYTLYVSLPSLIQGRKWVLLYSTWKHGISLSTLYRRSMLCPGYSLLAVGDREGAVFGGLVESPLRPMNNKKYQFIFSGSNNTFLFTNSSSDMVIFRPTGINRYFTLCSTEFLAFGGGSHFALYLDSELLSGTSSASETFNNCCLSKSSEFVVKEVELWGFAYASKYDEILASCQTETHGICRW